MLLGPLGPIPNLIDLNFWPQLSLLVLASQITPKSDDVTYWMSNYQTYIDILSEGTNHNLFLLLNKTILCGSEIMSLGLLGPIPQQALLT